MLLLSYDLGRLPPLHSAAGKGDIDELTQLLDLGTDIDMHVDTGTGYQSAAKRALTPLMLAAGSVFGSAAAVRILLLHGANPRALSGAGVDALWYAAGRGDLESAAMLLAMGSDPHAVSADGISTVAQAARAGVPETLDLLLREGASPHPPGGLAGYSTTEGQSIPLFAAATSGSAACVQLLLERGADATARDNNGRTPLMYAGGPEVIPLLIAAGCSLDICDPYGWSALNIALTNRNTATEESMRAAPDVADMRILEPDIQRRQAEVVAGLLDAGAELEARAEGERTALLWASQYAVVPALVELLIRRGANIIARDAEGRSALHLAWQKGDLIRLLVDAGIPVDVRDSQGYTPLHFIVQKPYGSVDATNALLDLGADIEAHTDGGLTPLMLAASALEQPDTLVTLLLERGADPRACTPTGRTARDYAIEHIAELENQVAAQDQHRDDSDQESIATVERRLALRRAYMALAALDRALGHVTQPARIAPQELPEPIWLGYRLQNQRLAGAYLEMYGIKTDQIVEVCSFAHTSWMDEANAAACFITEDAAVEFFLDKPAQSIEMYAYRAFPLLFDASGIPQPLKPFDILGADASAPEPPDLTRYARLGYDATECSLDGSMGFGNWIGCSPLSLGCNGMALGMGSLVNRHCLIDDIGAAYDMALLFGMQQPEPGPYIIIEVWRRTTG